MSAQWFDWMGQPESWAALATLLGLELVLGIDNVIFIAILAGKLPPHQRKLARTVGLTLAMGTRVGLLFSLAWMARLTAPLFALWGHELSGRDLILLLGGVFLLAKSTHEIHQRLEGEEGATSARVRASLASVLVQIVLLDLVFSLDSIITAVGMVNNLALMVTAVLVAAVLMIAFAGALSGFVERHPTFKMLALSFLLLIGVTLVAEGFEQHIPKGYLYFAMAFSAFVESLNVRLRGRQGAAEPVRLHEPYRDRGAGDSGESASYDGFKPR
jgi:predicted tellurium resistance membrane protein TerC